MKILILPYTHTLSHISRPLAIAIELRKRGHEVVFAGDSPKDNFIKVEGFEVLPAYQIAPNILYERIRRGELKFVHEDELTEMIQADRLLFMQVEPDLVLSDGRFSAPISTGIDGLKHAAIVNVSSTEYRALPYIPFFGWVPESIVKRDSGVWSTLDRINLKLEMLVFDNAASIFKKMSKKHHLRRKVTATNCLEGNNLTLLADIEDYFPARNLPSTYHYIGPLTWNSPLPQPDWWPPIRKGHHLVYFTMGTTWMGGSFSKLYELIRMHGITAIISTGGQIKGEEATGLRSIEGEVYVEEFVDGDLVMKECDVVVCHGGNGTVYQALQHGKPIIGIPTIPDQEFNMRRVEALRVGRRISIKDLKDNPSIITCIIDEVLNDKSFGENAKKYQKVLKKYDGPRMAADHIERLLGK